MGNINYYFLLKYAAIIWILKYMIPQNGLSHFQFLQHKKVHLCTLVRWQDAVYSVSIERAKHPAQTSLKPFMYQCACVCTAMDSYISLLATEK